MSRTSFAIAVAAAAAALLGACGGTSGPPPQPSLDTFWLAPRTSEVDLKLVTTQPTSPF